MSRRQRTGRRVCRRCAGQQQFADLGRTAAGWLSRTISAASRLTHLGGPAGARLSLGEISPEIRSIAIAIE